MKFKVKNQNSIIHLCTVLLLAFANIISYSGSFLLHGEPKVPKSLIR